MSPHACPPSVRSIQMSRQDRLHPIHLHIRQPKSPALELEGHAFVVDAQQVEDGGLEAVDVYRVFYCVVAELVAGAVADAGLDAATGSQRAAGTPAGRYCVYRESEKPCQ